MGWDPITSPAPLATKKVTGRLCMLEQPTNIWQIHPDSCEIFPLLTSDWLTVFWIRFSIFFPLSDCPISLVQPGCIGSALRHEEQLSYCQQASQNLLPLSKWTEILSKSYVEQRDLGWKLDECFILFAHISLAPLWNSAIFFIVSLHNDQHLLVLIALVNTWHRLILSCVLAHCETWKSNKFQLLWGFHTRGSQSTLSESFMQWADGDAIHLLLAQSRFPPAT